MSSGHDGLLSLPVEFLARDGQLFAHSLENLVLRVIQCVLDDGLVGSLVLVDGGHDDGGVGGLQVHVLILAHKVELDVASLPVVIIDLDDAVQLLVLDVDGPLGLPLARPEVVQLQVDARDVHLQVARLVEAQRGAGSVLLVVLHNILLNKFRNAVLVGAPVLVDLLWEVVGVSVGFGLQRQGVEAELDVVFGVEVDEFVGLRIFLVFLLALVNLDRLLAPHLVDHDNAIVVELDLLAVRLVVLSERIANSLSV